MVVVVGLLTTLWVRHHSLVVLKHGAGIRQCPGRPACCARGKRETAGGPEERGHGAHGEQHRVTRHARQLSETRGKLGEEKEWSRTPARFGFLYLSIP